MNSMKVISGLLAGAMLLSGCSTMSNRPEGSAGPKLISGYEDGYVQVGVEFSSAGDFVALVNPNRWKNPLSPGGSISWLNPGAWRHDWGRTGRVLLGELVIVGAGAAAAASGGGGGGDSGPGGPTNPTGGGGSPPTPPPPPAG